LYGCLVEIYKHELLEVIQSYKQGYEYVVLKDLFCTLIILTLILLNMRIAIGSDHAGFELKAKLIEYLREKGEFIVEDFGCFSTESVDYPDFAHATCLSIENKTNEMGILICGSGNGISMAANKHQGIRAALCWTPEIAELARLHNDANIVSLPARFISEQTAILIVDSFLSTAFEGGRHQKRVEKIACC
jgi:ribose 5-phosphate isomerase B